MTPLALPVAVSGNQANGGAPSFTGTVGSLPAGVTVDTSGLSCSQVTPATAINGSLPSGGYTLAPGSCAGVTVERSERGQLHGDLHQHGRGLHRDRRPRRRHPASGPHLRLLARRLRRGHLHVRVRPVLRVDRQHPTAATGRRDQPDREQGRVLAGGVRWWRSSPSATPATTARYPAPGCRRRGRGAPHSLNAPIVGMVPSSDGGGYFMVASDGGVFAFGDARFEGSCPGMGGCSGAAVAVVPDASGNGYWLVTQTGNVYAFGDATFYGAPGEPGLSGDVGRPNGRRRRLLGPPGQRHRRRLRRCGAARRPRGVGRGVQPGFGHLLRRWWRGLLGRVGAGDVFAYGDAPNDGSMAGNHLNGSIIAATGF